MELKAKKQIEIMLPILLFVVFVILMVGITLNGAGIYSRLQAKNDLFFDQTTFSDYIRTKTATADQEGMIRIGSFGEGDALFLQDGEAKANGETYETVLYFYEGYLMEQYKSTENELTPAAGNKILQAEGFQLEKINGNCFKSSLQIDGKWQDAEVYAATGIKGN